MPSLDTNVLARWLVADDVAQLARIQSVLAAAKRNQDVLFVPDTVVLELEWVLRSRYQLDKGAVIQAFNALLETQELAFQSEAALEWALHLYRQSATEFADCLHAGISAVSSHSTLLRFDQKAGKLSGVKLL